MAKKALLVLICIIGLIIFASTIHGQGPKKTITLANGDVIHDLNGEWDVYIEQGIYGNYSTIHKITQTNDSAVGIRMEDRPPHIFKGSEVFRCKLDKNGFKYVHLIAVQGPMICKGQISKDGNKMVIENNDLRSRLTYTRK
jgi:hypothetical protein